MNTHFSPLSIFLYLGSRKTFNWSVVLLMDGKTETRTIVKKKIGLCKLDKTSLNDLEMSAEIDQSYQFVIFEFFRIYSIFIVKISISLHYTNTSCTSSVKVTASMEAHITKSLTKITTMMIMMLVSRKFGVKQVDNSQIITVKRKRSWGLFLERSETFRAYFGWHHSLCIFKTKASRGKKICSYFYFQFYFLYNIWKDQLYRISRSEFYEWVFGTEKFSELSWNGPLAFWALAFCQTYIVEDKIAWTKSPKNSQLFVQLYSLKIN